MGVWVCGRGGGGGGACVRLGVVKRTYVNVTVTGRHSEQVLLNDD